MPIKVCFCEREAEKDIYNVLLETNAHYGNIAKALLELHKALHANPCTIEVLEPLLLT